MASILFRPQSVNDEWIPDWVFLGAFMSRGPQNELYSIPASQYQDVCDTLGAGLLSEQVVHLHIIKMYWAIPFSLVTQ